ncbi:MAG: hypothetical protein U0326_07455 [Polyangiales bacterium]
MLPLEGHVPALGEPAHGDHDRVGDERNAAHGIMLKLAPVSWRNDEDGLDRRLAALRRGVGL